MANNRAKMRIYPHNVNPCQIVTHNRPGIPYNPLKFLTFVGLKYLLYALLLVVNLVLAMFGA